MLLKAYTIQLQFQMVVNVLFPCLRMTLLSLDIPEGQVSTRSHGNLYAGSDVVESDGKLQVSTHMGMFKQTAVCAGAAGASLQTHIPHYWTPLALTPT